MPSSCCREPYAAAICSSAATEASGGSVLYADVLSSRPASADCSSLQVSRIVFEGSNDFMPCVVSIHHPNNRAGRTSGMKRRGCPSCLHKCIWSWRKHPAQTCTPSALSPQTPYPHCTRRQRPCTILAALGVLLWKSLHTNTNMGKQGSCQALPLQTPRIKNEDTAYMHLPVPVMQVALRGCGAAAVGIASLLSGILEADI